VQATLGFFGLQEWATTDYSNGLDVPSEIAAFASWMSCLGCWCFGSSLIKCARDRLMRDEPEVWEAAMATTHHRAFYATPCAPYVWCFSLLHRLIVVLVPRGTDVYPCIPLPPPRLAAPRADGRSTTSNTRAVAPATPDASPRSIAPARPATTSAVGLASATSQVELAPAGRNTLNAEVRIDIPPVVAVQVPTPGAAGVEAGPEEGRREEATVATQGEAATDQPWPSSMLQAWFSPGGTLHHAREGPSEAATSGSVLNA
jgi:hypothetical protein